MARILRSFSVLLIATAIAACSSSRTRYPELEVWRFHILSERGQRMGMIRVQVSGGRTTSSCIAYPPGKTYLGTVLETKGMPDWEPIGEYAAVYFDGNRLEMDLNLGWCDSNAVLSGYTDGRKAAGEYLHNSSVGYIKIGNFYGNKE